VYAWGFETIFWNLWLSWFIRWSALSLLLPSPLNWVTVGQDHDFDLDSRTILESPSAHMPSVLCVQVFNVWSLYWAYTRRLQLLEVHNKSFHPENWFVMRDPLGNLRNSFLYLWVGCSHRGLEIRGWFRRLCTGASTNLLTYTFPQFHHLQIIVSSLLPHSMKLL
jgi:hypothetical protein